jgi:ribosome-binding factor A
MKFFRSQRVSKLVREELSKIIGRELEFSNALVTLTEVEIDKKLEHAKVDVSVIPSERADDVLDELERKAGYLQHLLMKRINIKPMPRIAFQLDRGYEHAAQIEKLFETELE